MPTPVTDPNLLSQLEGGGGPKPVTDPALLQQLEGSETKDPRAGRGVMGWLQDLPGRIGRGLDQAAGGMVDAAAAGPKGMAESYRGNIDPTGKEAAGLGFQAATMFSPMSPAAGTARMIAPASRAANVTAPTREELEVEWEAGYDKLRTSDAPLPPEHAGELAKTIKGKLNDRDFDAEDQPATFRAVERLIKPSDQFGTGAGSAREIYKVRSKLNQITGDNPGKSEGAAARLAMEHIEEYLEQVPSFAATAKAARGNYRAGAQSDRITEGAERARRDAAQTGSGGNLPNKLRQSIGKIRNNPKIPKTPEEIAAMDAIMNGGTGENIARIVNKLGPKHPLTALLGYDIGGLTLAGVSTAIGHVAQYFSERLPMKKIEALDEMVRRNSPLGQERAKAGPPPFYRQPYGAPPTTAFAGPAAAPALGQPSGDALAPGGGDALGKQSSILDALSPVSSAQAAENPIRGGKPPPDEALSDKPTHGGVLALPEVGAGARAPPRQSQQTGFAIIAGQQFRGPVAQLEQLEAARRGGAGPKEIAKMIESFKPTWTPSKQSATWTPQMEAAYKDYRRGGGGQLAQDNADLFEARLKQEIGGPEVGAGRGVAVQRTGGDVFAAKINQLVKNVPDTKPFQGKVALKDLYDAYMKDNPREGMSLNTFKYRLVNAAKDRKLDLARSDMPERMDKDLRQQSEVAYGDDAVHFMVKPQVK